MGSCFLINDLCGSVQPIVSGATPGQVVLGYIRNQVEQPSERKAVSNIPPWPLIEFLPPGS